MAERSKFLAPSALINEPITFPTAGFVPLKELPPNTEGMCYEIVLNPNVNTRELLDGLDSQVRQLRRLLSSCDEDRVRLPADLNASRPKSFDLFVETRVMAPMKALFDQLKSTSGRGFHYEARSVFNGAAVLYTCNDKVSKFYRPSPYPLFLFLQVQSPGIMASSDWKPGIFPRSPHRRLLKIIFFLFRSVMADMPGRQTIITDLHQTMVSITATERTEPSTSRRAIFTYTVIKPPACQTIRSILFANIYGILSRRYPEACVSHREDYFGALPNPEDPLVPDAVYFPTIRRLSDFDLRVLCRDRQRALQFFRWKKQAESTASLRPCTSGDILIGNRKVAIRGQHLNTKNRQLPRIPSATLAFLASVSRPQPAEFGVAIENACTMEIRLTRKLTGNAGMGVTCAFTGQVVSVDGRAVGAQSPVLCLRLFDDRLAPMEHRNENDEGPISSWFRDFVTAEEWIMRETNAYRAMEVAQGSVLPKFYGVLDFSLPNGQSCYGVLTEHVADAVVDLCEGSMIEVIQSARHALRVLQACGISQRDWSLDRLVFREVAVSEDVEDTRLVCVINGLSSTTVVGPSSATTFDDHAALKEALIDKGLGLSLDLLEKHFGP